MKYWAVFLVVLVCGCARMGAVPQNLHESTLATLAVVDTVEDIADIPQIPDTLQNYQSVPEINIPETPLSEISDDANLAPVPDEDSQAGDSPSDASGGDETLPDLPGVDLEPSPSVDAGGESRIEKPFMLCYTSETRSECPVCNQVHDWWDSLSREQKESLPFTLHFVKDKSKFPAEYRYPPTFHWNAKDGSGRKLEGWYGPEHLVRAWRETQ